MLKKPLELMAALGMITSGLTAQAQPTSGEPVVIPYTLSGDVLMIPARIGDISVNLIFDTGAGLDVLATSLIARAHGRPVGTFSAHRMTGERIDIPLFEVPEIALGPLLRKAVVVGGWDVLDSLHVDGIISMNGFRERAFTLDFAGQTLVLETARSLRRRESHGLTSPFKLDDFHGTALDLIARFRFGDQSGDCEIDTGSPSATLSLRYLAPLGVDTNSTEVRRRERRTIAGARAVSYSTTLPEIALAAAPAVAQSQPRVAFADIIYDCVIGTDFWAGRAVTVDIPHRRLIVSSRTP